MEVSGASKGGEVRGVKNVREAREVRGTQFDRIPPSHPINPIWEHQILVNYSGAQSREIHW
jgi:hypothetical protein